MAAALSTSSSSGLAFGRREFVELFSSDVFSYTFDAPNRTYCKFQVLRANDQFSKDKLYYGLRK